MKAWKRKASKKVFWASEEELGGTKEEEPNRDGSDTEGPIEVNLASTMWAVCQEATEDKGEHRYKRRTGNSLSLSVPCSV